MHRIHDYTVFQEVSCFSFILTCTTGLLLWCGTNQSSWPGSHWGHLGKCFSPATLLMKLPQLYEARGGGSLLLTEKTCSLSYTKVNNKTKPKRPLFSVIHKITYYNPVMVREEYHFFIMWNILMKLHFFILTYAKRIRCYLRWYECKKWKSNSLLIEEHVDKMLLMLESKDKTKTPV